jgi:hypothetical protein
MSKGGEGVYACMLVFCGYKFSGYSFAKQRGRHTR